MDANRWPPEQPDRFSPHANVNKVQRREPSIGHHALECPPSINVRPAGGPQSEQTREATHDNASTDDFRQIAGGRRLADRRAKSLPYRFGQCREQEDRVHWTFLDSISSRSLITILALHRPSLRARKVNRPAAPAETCTTDRTILALAARFGSQPLGGDRDRVRRQAVVRGAK